MFTVRGLHFGGWLLLLFWTALGGVRADFVPSRAQPPEVPREFRGAWVATVYNIDWPSRQGLSAEQQQREMIAILDRAAALNLNAIVFQVRPAGDAVYNSRTEPWSHVLTGTMGQAPSYDPLEFAIQEAHRRGLQLHAWFNPFRARTSGPSQLHQRHIARRSPRLVHSYGNLLWMDPGQRAAQDHSLNVIRDVVRRYDIDGVHIDDYFYPYPIRNSAGRPLPFPDQATYDAYRRDGGRLELGDWRRQNIDGFIERLYGTIKSEKRHVLFGISPFGIWRPGVPPTTIAQLDAYEHLHADSRNWWHNGWVDYLSPQLYWSIDPPAQSFPVLLRWWAEENRNRRHLWPGVATDRIGPQRPAGEIIRQIAAVRQQSGADGQIHWHMKPLMENRGGIDGLLRTQAYPTVALPPPSPWLGRDRIGAPRMRADAGAARWDGDRNARWWVFQYRTGGNWHTRVLREGRREMRWESGNAPTHISVRGVDQYGNMGPATVLERR